MFDFFKKKPKTPDALLAGLTVAKPNFIERLKTGLAQTRSKLGLGLKALFQKKIDQALFIELENLLLSADVGLATTAYILKELQLGLKANQADDGEALYAALQDLLVKILKPCELPLVCPESDQPFVILMVGVNGSGKTTSIGKMAQYYQDQGKRVILAAGDTFRAAAVEQLQIWGERNQVAVIAQGPGADSASVLFDALTAAISRSYDILIADTAGRLHTQSTLMDELKKIKRVLHKCLTQAPHEILLVLDASIGQNALVQARQFHEAVGVTGLVLTKFDGSGKGGMLFGIAHELKLPIRFIGVGEGIDDLRPFNSEEFVAALLEIETPIQHETKVTV